MGEAHRGKPSQNKGKKLRPLTADEKLKISLASKGHITSEETRLKLHEANAGRIHITDGKIEKVVRESELEDYIVMGFVKGCLPCSDFKRQRASEGLLGHKVSDETKQKISETNSRKI